MGNLINPLGGRVNLINFWRHTWPFFYQNKNQNLYHQLAIHIRVLFHCFLRKLGNLKKKKKKYRIKVGILNGLIIKILSNIWGFNSENLTIYLKFFDYGATVALTKALPHRFLLKRLFSGLLILREMRKLLRITPVLFSGVDKKKKKKKRTKRHLFLFTLGFMSKLERSLLYRSFRNRRIKPKFSLVLQKLIQRTFLSFQRVLHFRLRAWHVGLILFTKPYLFYICKLFCIKKCFVFTSISKSTVSATMITRYIAAKCQQGFSVSFVLNTIRRILRNFIHDSYGYKLCASGRFTRKQIATYRWFKNGMLSLNSLDAGVEYAQDSGFSKFGIFGIKLWVFRISNPQHED